MPQALKPSPACFRNQLLHALADDDLARLTPRLEAVEMVPREEVEKPNRPIEHIFFPESCVISVVARARQKPLEIGLIGREGMSGLAVVMGDGRSPYSSYVQISGRAQRMASDDLRAAMDASSTLRETLLRFAQAFMIQTAHTAISNANGKLEERLARWLLMAHDRVDGDDLPLVHEFLALMLAVRRAGVTVALNKLDQMGLIRAERRRIVVLDRKGLRKVAGGLYGVPEAEYSRMLIG